MGKEPVIVRASEDRSIGLIRRSVELIAWAVAVIMVCQVAGCLAGAVSWLR